MIKFKQEASPKMLELEAEQASITNKYRKKKKNFLHFSTMVF